MKYDMNAELIPNDSFLHTAHKVGLCSVMENKNTLNSVDTDSVLVHEAAACPLAADSDIVNTIAISTFDCISLLRITKNPEER